MNLEQFVKEVLVQIARGATAAREAITPEVALVAEPLRNCTDGEMVSFDVAVVTTDEQSAKGGIGVAGIISAGGKVGTSASESQTSRVQFQVRLEIKGKHRFK